MKSAEILNNMENLITFKFLCMIFLSFCFCFILRRRFRTRSFSKPHTINLPPSPPGLPIIGHLHLLTDMPHHSFAQLAHKLGPIFYVRLGRIPTVVISSPELAELVLKTHDHIFANRPQLVSAKYLSFNCSDITFSPYGPYWRQARKICMTELLSSKRVNSFRLVRNEEVNRTLRIVSDHANSNSAIDTSDLFFRLANDILCRVAFGKRFIRSDEEFGEKKKELELAGVLKETQALLAGFCWGDFFPEWENWVNIITGTKKRLMKNLEDLRNVCDEIIDEHHLIMKMKKKREKDDDEREDFVDVLLRVQRKSDLEVAITDDNLKALVLDMFVAGTDTTAATLEWAMTELAKHPKLMKKAQNQVRQIKTPTTVEETDLRHLPYLVAIIKETLRLHPPVPLLVPRESMSKCAINGYDIPARTRILINTFAIGRNAEYWKSPLEFNPDRFLDFKGQDFRFLPFGGGRRGCPGYSFGLATVEISLARLLYHFDWSLPPGVGTDGLDLSEVFGLATRKKTALKLVPMVNLEHPFPSNV